MEILWNSTNYAKYGIIKVAFMRYTKEKEGDLYGKEKNENMEENFNYNFNSSCNIYHYNG